MTSTSALPTNTPLGVAASKEHVFLFYRQHQGKGDTFQIDSSRDGIKFNHHHRSASIRNKQKRKIKLKNCSAFRVTLFDDKYFLTHKYQVQKQTSLFGAVSEDLVHWQHTGKIEAISETGVLVPQYSFENSRVMYFGDTSIRVAYSKDLKQWEIGETILKSGANFYGQLHLQAGTTIMTDEGILLLYYTRQMGPNYGWYSLNAAVFDKNNPAKILRMYDKPIWESDESWANTPVSPLGVVDIHGQLISYWDIGHEGVQAIVHPVVKKWTPQRKYFSAYLLQKLQHNPIIKPIVDHFWESRATFNPAAVYEGGQVHIVYRAVGDRDVSVLGYATSCDGVNIDYRHPEPIYTPTQEFEASNPYSHRPLYSPYASGGGCFGGCEDPRITKFDDRFYMMYVAYNGMHHPRVALTSIKVKDFLDHKWNWDTPVLISPPGMVDKNACLLPEKVNGKYVIFHRIFPNILVDYVDSLEFDGQTYLEGEFQITPRRNFWDSRKIGVGAPPIKTPQGWLLIYQAVGDQDPSRYKMGAMLLDLQNPTRVLHRSNKPILEPYEWYENEGHKAGVAYPCGAVTLHNQLFIYYGGADTVVCAASAPLPEFLSHLTSTESAQLTPTTATIALN